MQRFSVEERLFKLTRWPVISAGGPHSAPSACQREGDEEKRSGKHEKRLGSVPGEARHITLKWHQKWTCGQQRSPRSISLKMQTTNPHSRHRSDHVTVIFFCVWHDMNVQSGLWYYSFNRYGCCWLSKHKTTFSCGTVNYNPIFPSTLPVVLPLKASASSRWFHSPWFD